MRIDVHAHYWTEDYLDLLVDLGKADAGAARIPLGGTGHPAAAERGRTPEVVRDRRARARPRPAVS
jgi:hypothetical protein